MTGEEPARSQVGPFVDLVSGAWIAAELPLPRSRDNPRRKLTAKAIVTRADREQAEVDLTSVIGKNLAAVAKRREWPGVRGSKNDAQWDS